MTYSTATVTVNVVALPNVDPIAVDDSVSMHEMDGFITIQVLNNDSDPDAYMGPGVSIVSVTDPANGTATINGDQIDYSYGGGGATTDSFTYTIQDEDGATATATVNIDITVVQQPTAVDDTVTVNENETTLIDVLANDTGPASIDSLSSSPTPNGGQISIVSNQVEYIPMQGFNGTDTFTYTITNDGFNFSSATVTVTVVASGGGGGGIIAVNDTVSIIEGQSITIYPLANDSDPNGNGLSIDNVQDPTNGTVTDVTIDSFIYTPDPGFIGDDVFTYDILSEASYATATVTVTVNANLPPDAVDDTATAEQDTSTQIDVLENDSDPENQTITITAITQPPEGTTTIETISIPDESDPNGWWEPNPDGSGDDIWMGMFITKQVIQYTPTTGSSGTEAFTYTITDAQGATDTATVTVTINANNPPIAVDDTASTEQGESVQIDVLANDSDPDNEAFSITAVTPPTLGTANVATLFIPDLSDPNGWWEPNPDGSGDDIWMGMFITKQVIQYTPTAGSSGSDTFTYTITDARGATDTATVTVTVDGNDPPIPATIGPLSLEEGETIEIDVLTGATDPEGHSISLVSVDVPAYGSANITTIYTPDLSDPGGWWDTDPDGNSIWMGATISMQVIQYTAAIGYIGSVTLSYTIQDELGAEAIGTVGLNVTANPPPDAVDDTASTEQDTSIQIDVLANDSDPAGEAFSITAITQPTNGTAAIATISIPDLSDPNGWWEPNPDGSGDDIWMGIFITKQVIQFTPAAGTSGTETFTYTITDERGASDTATVTINTTPPPNNPPEFDDNNQGYTFSIDENSSTFDTVPIVNAIDPDGDTVSYDFTGGTSTSLDGTTNTLTAADVDALFAFSAANGNNILELLQTLDYEQTTSYTLFVEANDGNGGVDSSTVTIDVGDVNEEPNNPLIDTSGSFAVAWEGGTFEVLLKATTTEGAISLFEVDFDQDGVFDISQESDPDGSALVSGANLMHLLGSPVDDDTYWGTLRVTTDSGFSSETPFEIRVGDVPPEIEIVNSENIDPGESYTLTISTSDPGPDQITQMTIDWGDGAQESFTTSNGDYSHVYSTTGEYLATITVTNEDTSNTIEWIVDIGDTNAPDVIDSDPSIISAEATVLTNGDASLLVSAVDQYGNDVASYAWDIDGDGLFNDAFGNEVILQSSGVDVFYTPALQITDTFGNTNEFQFAFAESGAVAAGSMLGNAGDNFRKATPDIPSGWQVHHTYEQGRGNLAQRLLKDKGINVHDLKNLRGVPTSAPGLPDVHSEIGKQNQAFWNKVKSDNDYATFKETYEKVDLDDYLKHVDDMDEVYKDFWIESGKKQKTRISKITNTLKKARAKWTVGRLNRRKAMGRVVKGAAFLAIFTGGMKSAMAIADHDAEQLAKWKALEQQYIQTLDQGENLGYIKHNRALHLKDAFKAYAVSLHLDQDAINKIDAAMGAHIDLYIPE